MRKTYTGRCHCGTVVFRAETDLDRVVRCNCSICRKKNALMHRLKKEDLTIVQGEDNLTVYQFNTRTAKHFFCKTCGIHPFHHTRVAPDYATVNVNCLDGVDADSLPVTMFDGQALS